MTNRFKGIFSQAIHFFAISGIGWLIDICFYSILSIWVPVLISNIISSSISITYVYMMSTKKIFSNKNTFNLKVKYIFYIFYQVFIILLSSFIIAQISDFLIVNISVYFIYKYAKICAKILVTPFTMVTNFIFMKFLIEKI